MDPALNFPDGPRADLEQSIGDLIERAQAVLRSQGRLRHLLAATWQIIEHLQLSDTLTATVEAAARLVDAPYSGLTLHAENGRILTTIYREGTVFNESPIRCDRNADRLPQVVVEPIRVDTIADVSDLLTFPASFPEFGGFMAVPIRSRNVTLGVIYLAHAPGRVFSAEDEELSVALAGSAGVAIENARLFEEAKQREQWATSSAEITTALLSDDDLDDVLYQVSERVAESVSADIACVCLPRRDGLMQVMAAAGHDSGSVIGTTFSLQDTAMEEAIGFSRTIRAGGDQFGPLRDNLPELGPTLIVPVGVTLGSGVLLVARLKGSQGFSDLDVDTADQLSQQITLASALARGRADRRAIERAEDRNAIARDLHDIVIQRLFAAGISLERTAKHLPEDARENIEGQIRAINEAMEEIRTVVSALNVSDSSENRTVREQLLEVISEVGAVMSAAPAVKIEGPIDHVVQGSLARDLLAVVRESLTNVARHAPESKCEILITATSAAIEMRVTDDGPGLSGNSRRSGTRNLAARADRRDGIYTLESRPEGGTSVLWRVPA